MRSVTKGVFRQILHLCDTRSYEIDSGPFVVLRHRHDGAIYVGADESTVIVRVLDTTDTSSLQYDGSVSYGLGKPASVT